MTQVFMSCYECTVNDPPCRESDSLFRITSCLVTVAPAVPIMLHFHKCLLIFSRPVPKESSIIIAFKRNWSRIFKLVFYDCKHYWPGLYYRVMCLVCDSVYRLYVVRDSLSDLTLTLNFIYIYFFYKCIYLFFLLDTFTFSSCGVLHLSLPFVLYVLNAF